MSKTFISYSHDNNNHKDNVLKLSDKLRELGVDASLDQYNPNPPEGWPRWMANEVRESNKILMICSQNYYQKAIGKVPVTVGKGGKFESHLIIDEFYQNGSYNEKILPVLLNGEKDDCIPEYLRSHTYFKISNFSNLEKDEGFNELYRELTGQQLIKKPKLGIKKVLPSGINLNNHSEEENVEEALELTINKPYDEFTKNDQKRILRIIAEALKMDEKKIKLIKKFKGSVKLHISLPKQKALELEELVENGGLLQYEVINAEIIKDYETIDSEVYFDIDEVDSEESSSTNIGGTRLKGVLRKGLISVGTKYSIVELGSNAEYLPTVAVAKVTGLDGNYDAQVGSSGAVVLFDKLLQEPSRRSIICAVGSVKKSATVEISVNPIAAGVSFSLEKQIEVTLGKNRLQGKIMRVNRTNKSTTAKVQFAEAIQLIKGIEVRIESQDSVSGFGKVINIE